MKTSHIIDFVDVGLALCLQVKEIDQLDANISVGMVFRIFFFILAIAFRDLNTYTWTEFTFQVLAWLCFHLFIIFLEIPYFLSGTSKTEQREKQYKVVDLLQQVIGTIYLSISKESIYDDLLLATFIFNICVNVFGMLASECQKKKKPNYDKEGGIKHISFGILLGTLSVILYLFIINSKYEEEISASSTLEFYLIITILGEMAAALFSFFFCCLSFKEYTFTNDCLKGFLGILYGINFGLFSLFYGFLIGIIIIIGFFFLCYEGCRKSSEVHPSI